jgi:hypothetical protein
LKLDGRGYSPLVLEQIVTAGASVKSFEAAALLLMKLAEVDVSPRHVNNLTTMVGEELAEAVDDQTEAYQEQPLPRWPTQPETPIALAAVACDGGRMQTRLANAGPGVHDAHWRETKNAGFFRMRTRSHAVDPHPALPRCFAHREHMSHLLDGVPEADQTLVALPASNASSEDWRPEVLFRTCLSSLCDSESFGPMMAAEADSRGLFAAERRAFLGDGQAYNWTIQKKHFPTFEPIVDFIHPLEYLYEAARAIHREEQVAWETFQAWAELTWQGGVAKVLATLRDALAQLPAEEEDRRETVAVTLTYLANNQSRMDYPRYRQEGLPVSSAVIESLIKEINYRVKGTEKFWNDDQRGEAILYVRAALLCHDDRLGHHLRSRHGSPYARPRHPSASIAA